MDFNRKTFEELPPPLPSQKNCFEKEGCNLKLPWQLKLPCNSGLQWTVMGGLLRNYLPPQKKIALKDRAANCGNGRIFGELPTN